MARTPIQAADGERIVETGTGVVIKLEHEPGKRNARVEFRATHTNLNDPVSGWLDTANEAGLELVRRSHAERIELEYRVEVHRKPGIDVTKSIAELGNREKVRDLVAVGAPGTLDRPTAANPPAPAAPAPAPAPAAAPAPQTPPPAPSSSQGTTAPRARASEARPFEELNSDGRPNLGSYAVQAGVGMVELALEVLDGAGLETRPATVEALAVDLMAAADGIQSGATGSRADRMDGSHPRARGLLRRLIERRPYPLELVVDAEGKLRLTDEGHPTASAVAARNEWHAKVTKAGAALFVMGVRVAGVDWRDA